MTDENTEAETSEELTDSTTVSAKPARKPKTAPKPEPSIDQEQEPAAQVTTTYSVPETKPLVAGPQTLVLHTDKNGNGRTLINAPEKAIERVKCEDLPGTPYVAQASQQTTWLGVFGAVPDTAVALSYNLSEFTLG